MREQVTELAGLRSVIVEPSPDAWPLVVLLHGYAMRPADLSPFAHSLGVQARFVFPEGPIAASPAGYAWWAIDEEARTEALARGPRDLHAISPPGLPLARARCSALLAEAHARWGRTSTVLVGFSQGGMLACDTALRESVSLDGLALLSSSCLSADEWEPLARRVAGMPVLVSHGRNDADLAFAAGERLRNLLREGGAEVTWFAGDHGHEIPFAVWRVLRRFLISCF